MTGQELATAFHHGVAPIVLVFNNQMYGTIRMYQERAYPGPRLRHRADQPRFRTFIEAFGGHGEVVAATEEFAPAFRRAVESGRPAVIELRMNPEQITTRADLAELRGGAKAPPKPPGRSAPPPASAPAVAREPRSCRRPNGSLRPSWPAINELRPHSGRRQKTGMLKPQ